MTLIIPKTSFQIMKKLCLTVALVIALPVCFAKDAPNQIQAEDSNSREGGGRILPIFQVVKFKVSIKTFSSCSWSLYYNTFKFNQVI